MKTAFLISGFAVIAIAASPLAAHTGQDSHVEIRKEPIAGQYDKHWYNYLADVLEADKELKSDLRRATDAEDTRDAWEEYENELIDADKDYVEEMRDRNFRAGRVTIGK
ncbi:hypothetical protein [Sphingorhabdus sp. SMR4y]|uniref:hypothetical protein n=1 Tax=Sphingorhabdus sp. SMR4y TaxID=2584094 RepID=UPI000B619ACD|nr:hypothetical protein [Sphingorhabdus sp. SMR4y]ASK87930.1 hypothetical protein SPHFLASMR4Y_01164 [Sphingorhabdus sp. SMR4y]